MMPPLLPRPKRIRLQVGNVRLDSPLAIRVGSDAPTELWPAARRLRDRLRERGIRAAIVVSGSPMPQGPGIHLGIFESPAAWSLPAHLPSPDEAYGIHASGSIIRVEGHGCSGLGHGVSTLLQLLRIAGGTLTCPAVVIADWPILRQRGVLEDISRWKVPTLVTLKRYATWLADRKINLLQLYTENNFRFRRYPKIGSGYGRMTPADIKSLDLHCRSVGIELMPNFASFGHMERILERPEFQKLSVGPPYRLIKPLVPETYRFLERLYDEFLPNFSSKTFNINCDETWDLGKGMSQKLVKRLGAGEVYLRHVLKVYGIVTKRHRKRVMMWGDILSHHPTFIKRLPRDLIVLPWGYFNRWTAKDVRPFRNAGLDYLICGGTSAWHSPSPWTHVAHKNISSAARISATNGGTGIITTNWGDGGHQQGLGISTEGLAFGAEQGWTGGRSSATEFDRRFGELEFGVRSNATANLWKEFGLANEALGLKPVYVWWWFTVNFGLLWYDHLVTPGPTPARAPMKLRKGDGPLFAKVTATGVRGLAACADRADRHLRVLERIPARISTGLDQMNRALVLRELRYAVRQLQHLAQQLDWRLRLKRSHRSAAISRRLRRDGQSLIADLRGIRKGFLFLWAARNRPQGKRVHLGLLRGTESFYRTLLATL